MTAQNNINFDPAAANGTGWIGFMNVFETPANGGGFVFASGWGVGDLVVVDNMDGTVSLKPNRVNDPDPFWQTGGLTGNKIMDASYYLQDDNLVGTAFTFNGEILANTIDDSALTYPIVYEAFIKVFNADYSSFTAYTADISSTGTFSIALAANQSITGDHVQYGFQMIGPNVNNNSSFDAQYDAIGSILVGPNTTLSVNELTSSEFKVYPNPSNGVWNIVSNNQEITSINVYDVLGKQVLSLNPNTQNVSIDASNLQSGLYFAKVNSLNGSQTIRLIKN